MSDIVFIGWVEHGRSEGIARHLDAESWTFRAQTAFKLNEYVLNALATWRRLRISRPRVVLFMQPPIPLLIVVWLYRILHRDVIAVGDLHSGYFNDRKWRPFAKFGLRLLRQDAVIVTNEHMASISRAYVRDVVVLHDVLEVQPARLASSSEGQYILFPLSYADDEPVAAILEAAQILSEMSAPVEFRLTGRPPAEIADRAPSTVRFLGWVEQAEYGELVAKARGVGALTLRDNTMQRAGYEAVAAGTPVITSPWPVLKEYFEDAAYYADPTPQSIARSVLSLLDDSEAARGRIREVQERRVAEQREALDVLTRICASS